MRPLEIVNGVLQQGAELGTAATKDVGTTSGTVCAGDDSRLGTSVIDHAAKLWQTSDAATVTDSWSYDTRFSQEMQAAYSNGGQFAMRSVIAEPIVTLGGWVAGDIVNVMPTTSDASNVCVYGYLSDYVMAAGNGDAFGVYFGEVSTGATNTGDVCGAYLNVAPTAGQGCGITVNVYGNGYTTGYRNDYVCGGAFDVLQSSRTTANVDGVCIDVYKENPISGTTTGLLIGACADGPQPYGGIDTFTIVDGGTGYTANDVISVTGVDGDGGTITVNTVDGAGTILTATRTTAGSDYTVEDLLTQVSVAPTGGIGAVFRVASVTEVGKHSADVHGIHIEYAYGYSKVYGLRVTDLGCGGHAEDGAAVYGVYVDPVGIDYDAPGWAMYIVSDPIYFGGAYVTAVRSITTAGSSTNALTSDHAVEFTGTLVQTYNLPACTTGRALQVHNSSTNNVTLHLAGSDTHNGAATDIVLTTNQGVTLKGVGSNWISALSAASLVGFIDASSCTIEAPTNKTYTIDAGVAVAGTLTTLKGVATSSGTLTMALKINGTSVTGATAISVTSTPQDVSLTALNTIAVGDIITIVVTSAASPVDLIFNLLRTRA